MKKALRYVWDALVAIGESRARNLKVYPQLTRWY
jgi:hypothetical protein